MSDEASAVVDVSDSVSAPVTKKSTTAAKKAATNAMKATIGKTGTSGKSPAGHPPYSDMVTATIRSLSSRTGVSRQAIIKKMKEDYHLGDNTTHISNWVNITLKKGLDSGLFKKAAAEGRKGAGSYKLGDQVKSSASLSKSRSSAKSVTARAPHNVKKPKIKKVTTPANRLKLKTTSKTAKSKVVKKIETSKAGKTKLKKTADAAIKKPTAGAKKPAAVAKKPVTPAKKPPTAVKKPVTAAKKPATAVKKPAKPAASVKKTTTPAKKAGSAAGGKKSGKS